MIEPTALYAGLGVPLATEPDAKVTMICITSTTAPTVNVAAYAPSAAPKSPLLVGSSANAFSPSAQYSGDSSAWITIPPSSSTAPSTAAELDEVPPFRLAVSVKMKIPASTTPATASVARIVRPPTSASVPTQSPACG